MTIKAILDALKRWEGLIVAIVVALFVIVLFRECGKASTAEGTLRREHEAGRLTDAGAPPEKVEDPARLLSDERARSAYFRAALEDAESRLKAAGAKGPKIVEVVKWSTKIGEAKGEARPSPAGCPACLLAPGDKLRIDVTDAREETRDGNRIPVATAACVRLLPEPRTVLFEQAIDLATVQGSVAPSAAPSRERAWLAGVGASTANGGSGGPFLGVQGARVGIAAGLNVAGSGKAEITGALFGRF